MKPIGLLTLVIMAVLRPDVLAQDKVLKLQFLAFPKQMRPQPVELLIGEGKTIEVQTPGHELSPEYEVPALATIAVGKTVVNEEGEPAFEVYGQAKSLGTRSQIVLLMRKGKENKDGFAVLPVNADLSNFKGASFLLINASTLNVGGMIGDTEFGLKPSQQKMIKPKPTHDGGLCQATFFYQREGDWKKFRDTRWPSNDNYRSLVFFFQDPETGRLGIAPVVDMLDRDP
ncbi:hypothetical protein [Haloferula sp. A504]|uniref:hypothetical protein n=1 Tax=Haloferula sp. A504 TaxID=3373601 RepID=UPI0031C681CC|nr:hypothetical protein [Verrucomicrobiaceae bacterium E54]